LSQTDKTVSVGFEVAARITSPFPGVSREGAFSFCRAGAGA
jgi:hypothetical protein